MRFFVNSAICIFVFFIPSLAWGVSSFVVEDIYLRGLQRIAPGTVFNYLPIKVGDEFDVVQSPEAIRALFKTGFFSDVQLQRDGNTLVFILKERPAIGSIMINGSDSIDKDELLENLSQIGFAEGQIFIQAQLQQVELELQRQYFLLGKYATHITSSITSLDDNRVAVVIDIAEGAATKIKQINIVGNTVFKEDQLLDQFSLGATTLFSFFTKRDQYSRQKLAGDLEALRSFYLDHGYLNFNIDSTQVAITPDKEDIYITINVTEGQQYTISEVKLGGDLILPEADLRDLLLVRSGQLFSRKEVTESSKRLMDRLGDEGYAFANVNPIPDTNKKDKTVALTFFVDPGRLVYVRRINFSGNSITRDEVLRREMRQQERAWISTTDVKRGKVRLQRLGFFKDVNMEITNVAGVADQVDVNYTVEEQPSGSLNFGLGLSQEQGLILQTSVSQNNIFGSGKHVSFAINNSEVNQVFRFRYHNPYYTIDGISRGLNMVFRKRDAFQANVTSFNIKEFGGGVDFGLPVSENNTLFFSAEYANTEIEENSRSSQEVLDFIHDNGSQYNLLKLSGSFRYDSRNKLIFPDKGLLSQIRAEVSAPLFSDALEYYKLDFWAQWLWPLYRSFVFSLKGNVGYGDGYAGVQSLPFFQHFYAGGPRSIRGYRANTLGPLGSDDRPIGGGLKLVYNVELILPTPFFADLDSVRFTGFFDAGNIFADASSFDIDELRYSAGFAVIWISPFGQISVSIANPIAEQAGDQIQKFQFNIGTSF